MYLTLIGINMMHVLKKIRKLNKLITTKNISKKNIKFKIKLS